MSTAHLIPSLEPKLRALYDRHKERAASIDWAYFEYLPLDELRADPQSLPTLSSATYLAVETALLTEVNLPWFTAGLGSVYRGALSPMREFIHEWTWRASIRMPPQRARRSTRWLTTTPNSAGWRLAA